MLNNHIEKQTIYTLDFQYLNKQANSVNNKTLLQFFPTAEGYVKPIYKATLGTVTAPKYQYVYNYTDHLGNIRLQYSKVQGVLKVLEETHYYPFGLKHGSYNQSRLKLVRKPSNDSKTTKMVSVDRSYKYKYNGKELQEEFGLNWYDYGARNLGSDIGRWYVIDPLTEKYYSWSPYNYTMNNPIRFIDPDGRSVENEYDKNGKKISNKGGDKIDFYHQANGDTKIVDRASGAFNIIKGGEALIRGYTHRNKSTSWSTLFYEFDQGVGLEKSFLSDFDNTTEGFFGSMDSPLSTYASKARIAVISGGLNNGKIPFNYKEVNPVTAAFDGWEQFLGRVNLSYYKLGDKVLFLMHDSKSFTSLSYRAGGSWDRSTFRLNGTTTQTYIWTESIGEVNQKAQFNQYWINRVHNSRQDYNSTKHQRIFPLIKY